MVKKLSLFVLMVVIGASLAGCAGYTTKSMLPDNIKSIHIAPVKNTVDFTAETGDKTRYSVYRPGLELELTNAIMNRFIFFDGTLKVTNLDKADAVIESELTEFRRDPVRYTDGDDVQEYRLNVFLHVSMYEKNTKRVLWSGDIVGDSTYFLSGPRALSEDDAINKAVDDLARRVVERTMEFW